MTFINLGKLFFKRLLLNVLKDRRYLLYGDFDLKPTLKCSEKWDHLCKIKITKKEKIDEHIIIDIRHH